MGRTGDHRIYPPRSVFLLTSSGSVGTRRRRRGKGEREGLDSNEEEGGEQMGRLDTSRGRDQGAGSYLTQWTVLTTGSKRSVSR